MILILLITVVICAYYLLSINYGYWKKRGVPHPPVSVLFGNLTESLTFKKSLGQIYDTIYNDYPSLPYVGFYKVRQPAILIRDPELVKEVLVKEFHSFYKNDLIIDEKRDSFIARNPFFSFGEKWKKNRSKITPAFTSRQTKSLYPLLETVSKRFNSYLEETGRKPDGIEAKDVCQKYTMDAVASCAVGLEANSFLEPNSQFRKMVRKILSPSFVMSIKLLFLFAIPSIARYLRIQFVPDDSADYFRNIVAQTMAYRKANNVTRSDFLGMMQDLKDKLGEETFSNEDVASHSAGFFVDGVETSSIVLNFALYELGANPDLQDKLRAEIDAAFLKHNGKLNYDIIQEMEYLNKFLNETLRMHPPGYFVGKSCTQPYKLPPLNGKAEVIIEPGTPVVIPIYSLHYDPKYYPDPQKFDPERFSEENKSNHVKYTFLPFGEGPRMCLGQRFAVAQIKTAIVHLLLDFEIRINNKTLTPLQIDPTYLLLAAKGGIWLNFYKRNNKLNM